MKKYTYEILLFISTILFGTSYIAQGVVGNYVGPLTINFIRYALSSLCLIPFVIRLKPKFNRDFFIGSLLLGLAVFVPTFFQQLVAPTVSSGKMGFMSSLYLVFVPLLSYILFKTKIKKLTLLSILLAFIGLILLCNLDGFWISLSDLELIVVAIAFAFEIILMDIYSKKVEPMVLMLGSFVISTLLNLVLALCFEKFTAESFSGIGLPLFYLSIGCTCIAYGLQALSQKYLDPIVATLIMSLESVISALAGYLIMHQVLSFKEIVGCIIVFAGVLLCEFSMMKADKD